MHGNFFFRLLRRILNERKYEQVTATAWNWNERKENSHSQTPIFAPVDGLVDRKKIQQQQQKYTLQKNRESNSSSRLTTVCLHGSNCMRGR